MDYKVDSKKLKQVFKLAGKVVSVDLATDKDGASRGFAVVEFDHPVEAVQAISMFDRQQFFDRRMTVRLDRVPDKSEGPKLPDGLKGIGLGLGNDCSTLIFLTLYSWHGQRFGFAIFASYYHIVVCLSVTGSGVETIFRPSHEYHKLSTYLFVD